jgi:membrane-bound inhibitor of C-type lysozyme
MIDLSLIEMSKPVIKNIEVRQAVMLKINDWINIFWSDGRAASLYGLIKEKMPVGRKT